jgi:ADP-ribose pyrophosphatase YjhB (NUDIX family)
MDESVEAKARYYASLATKRVGSGLVCRDSAGRVLLVRPTYKPTWEVPGGAVEANESPAAAVGREVREELGIPLPIGRLLVIDWLPARPPKTEGLMFMFDGGVLDGEVTKRFSLPADELREWAFFDPDRLDSHVTEHMARRLRAALAAVKGAGTRYLEGGVVTTDDQSADADPYASLKDNAWRDVAELDARLAGGGIDEAEWHAEMTRLIAPAYLAAQTPWEGSGKSGSAEDWEYARSHIAHAIDRPGSFLDIGCANGYLLECLTRWTPYPLDRYGVDIVPELVEQARARLPEVADQLFVGNALTWEPPHRVTYIRAGLEYVPPSRRPELAKHLFGLCERLVIGVFNEEVGERSTEERLRSWGFQIAGRSDRTHPYKLGMEYRVLWIDGEVL